MGMIMKYKTGTVFFGASLLFSSILIISIFAVPEASGGLLSAEQKNDVLLSATSAFEDLSEYALTGNSEGMKTALEAYEARTAAVHAILPEQARKNLDALVDGIREAIGKGKDESAALKAVEAYGVLISSLYREALKIPAPVSWLDYAGFKLKALLHAGSPDWSAIRATAAFAEKNWNEIMPRVEDYGLRDSFGSVIAGMNRAIGLENREMALFAAQMDLDLVDLLEGYFVRLSNSGL